VRVNDSNAPDSIIYGVTRRKRSLLKFHSLVDTDNPTRGFRDIAPDGVLREYHRDNSAGRIQKMRECEVYVDLPQLISTVT